MENGKPISYGFEDILRYKNGLMSKEEMHAFEKASMEDPFLADALEGYMEADMDIAGAHHEMIKNNLAGQYRKTEEAVVVPMPRKNFAMWRVAAMIIVIAGAGLLAYRLFDQSKTPGEANSPMASLPRTDSNSTATNSALQKDTAPATSPIVENGNDDGRMASLDHVNKKRNAVHEKQQTKSAAVRGEEIAKANDERKESGDATREEVVAAAPPRQTAANAKSYRPVPYNEFRGTVLTPSNEPLANASVRIDNSSKQTLTDNSGNFVLNANDTVVNATVVSQGYVNARVQLRSSALNTINLSDAQLQNEAAYNRYEFMMPRPVVTGLAVKKKAQIPDTISVKPQGGWLSFHEYIITTLKTPADSATTDSIGAAELELEFYIDANGAPKDFKILRSSNVSLNEPAIEAIKKGPRWSPKKKKARVLIRL